MDQLTLLQKERLKWKPEVPIELSNLIRLTNKMDHTPKRVGVILSGGQAPGGHNVIAGLLDGMLQLNPDSKLIGFLNGPRGILEDKAIDLTPELVDRYRNQGGFDMLASGRDKVQLEKAKETVLKERLDGLVMIGGDDTNTSAAHLAEYFAKEKVPCSVMGVPKTIDGDLRSEFIQISFGFDTACKTYAEMIGNIARDILSAKKYYAFIRMMGRSASHVTLECALMTQPNLAIISEEKLSLKEIVGEIVDLIKDRAKAGKNYGVILLPEGLIESIPDFQVTKEMDPHGNLKVSQIETERFIIDLVKKEVEVSALPFFLGYEGRSAMPSNFDANYGYALGLTAALAVDVKANGHICTLQKLHRPAQEWTMTLVPLVQMMEGSVVKRTLVDLNGELFKRFKAERSGWRVEDAYRYWGPIQFFGPKELTDSVVEI